jgi:hypothetical protein
MEKELPCLLKHICQFIKEQPQSKRQEGKSNTPVPVMPITIMRRSMPNELSGASAAFRSCGLNMAACEGQCVWAAAAAVE